MFNTKINWFTPTSLIYRGTIEGYVKNQTKLTHIKRVEIENTYLASGEIESYTTLTKLNSLRCFMRAINDNKVKDVSFLHCTLNPNAGAVVGDEIKQNQHLENLEITSSQLEKFGMIRLLEGLIENKSLKKVYCRSYNVETYSWSFDEVYKLRQVLASNTTLTELILPDNQLTDPHHITYLAEPYKNATGKNLATISGFWLSNTFSIPDFNHENAINGSLERLSLYFRSKC